MVLKPARPIPIGPGSIYIHRGRQSFPNTELRQSASADNPLLLTQSASADNLLLPKLILPGTTAFGTLVTSGVGITCVDDQVCRWECLNRRKCGKVSLTT